MGTNREDFVFGVETPGAKEAQTQLKGVLNVLRKVYRESGPKGKAGALKAAAGVGKASTILSETRANTEATKKYSKSLRDVSKAAKLSGARLDRLAEKAKRLRKGLNQLSQRFTLGGLYQMAIFVRSLITSFMVLAATVYGVVFAVRALVKAANELRSGKAALQIVAKSTGREWKEVQRIMNDVVRSGFLPLVTATKMMVNLLAIKKASLKEVEAGMWSIIAATQAMKRGQIGTAEAAQMVAEGIRQQMSRMTDAAGEGVNVKVINKEMAESMGLVLSQLSFEETQRLTLIGYTKKHRKFLDMLTDTQLKHARATNKVTTAWIMFKAELGEAIMPLFTEFMIATLPVIRSIRQLTSENKKWLEEAIRPLIKRLPQLASNILAVIASLGKLFISWVPHLPMIIKYSAISMMAVRVLALVAVGFMTAAKAGGFLKATLAALTGNLVGFVQGMVSLGIVVYYTHQITKETAALTNATEGLGKQLESFEVDVERIKNLSASVPELGSRVAGGSQQTLNVEANFNIHGMEDLDEGVDEVKGTLRERVGSLYGRMNRAERTLGIG